MPLSTEDPVYDDAEDYTDSASTFGDRIAAAREANGMTPEELSRRLGVRTQTLLNWEEDRSEPRANRMRMLAGLLNVSIIWLMSGQGNGPQIADRGAGADGGEFAAALDEMREIRLAQTTLTTRLARLEKRLRTMRP